MNPQFSPADICQNQKGIVMVVCLLVLLLVTLLGVMSVRTSQDDLQITANHQLYNKSFYAAEAAKAYVRNNPDLYGSLNITTGNPVYFPNASDPAASQTIISNAAESFNGEVEYLNSSTPPRGSGYQVGKFRSHIYQMTCRGHGPRNATTLIEAGFYRIGF
jgi:hypothetical protein